MLKEKGNVMQDYNVVYEDCSNMNPTYCPEIINLISLTQVLRLREDLAGIHGEPVSEARLDDYEQSLA